jgi:hypothetical protein
MATTPIYGLRYPTMSDLPDGPDLGEDLATDVEAELDRMEKYYVEVSNSVTQSVNGTALTFNTEITDNEDMRDPATPTRLIAPISGRYLIKGAWYTGSMTGGGVVDTYIRENGVTQHWRTRLPGFIGANNYPNVIGEVVLSASEYVEIIGAWSEGAIATISPFARATMRYLGPP